MIGRDTFQTIGAEMSNVLIAYTTKHGHTAKIARAIAQSVHEAGLTVEVHDVRSAPEPRPGDYELVVAGASIHAGRHQKEMIEWTQRNAEALSAMPSAFFSVCLAPAEDNEESRSAAAGYLSDFLDATGWTPRKTRTFAGALQYREYDFMTRLLMRLLMKHGHHPTDTSHDYDYTNWGAVAEFGRECTEMVATAPAGAR